MSVQKKQRRESEKDNDGFSLLANGSAGGWEVAVDETTKGPNRWFVQLEGPSVSFSFEVRSPEVVSRALEFLERRSLNGPVGVLSAKDPSLVLSKNRQTPVVLVRDDEYKDRYFLVMGEEPDFIIRFTIAGQDLENIQGALRQATEDLENGWAGPVSEKQ